MALQGSSLKGPQPVVFRSLRVGPCSSQVPDNRPMPKRSGHIQHSLSLKPARLQLNPSGAEQLSDAGRLPGARRPVQRGEPQEVAGVGILPCRQQGRHRLAVAALTRPMQTGG